MALNTCKMCSCGIKIAFFSKTLEKSPSVSQTLICDTFELQNTFLLKHISKIWTLLHFNYWFKPSPWNGFLALCQHQATASDLPFYNIFASTKNFSFEVSDDVIACDLWFGPPLSKILATPM